MEKSELSGHAEKWSRELESSIRAALGEIRYGSGSLVISEGKDLHIDKSEKIKLK